MTRRPLCTARGFGALGIAAALLAGCSAGGAAPAEVAPPAEAAPSAHAAQSGTKPEEPTTAAATPPATTADGAPPASPLDADALWHVSLPASAGTVLGLLLTGWSATGATADPLPVTTVPPIEEVDERADDAIFVTIDPALVELGTPLTLSLTGPGSFTATTDGGLVLRDATGAVVAGVSPPTSGARLVPDGDAFAHLVLRTPTGDEERAPVTLSIGRRGVDSAQWRERSDGPSLFVDPTSWARSSGEAGWALVWAELLAAHPEVDTPAVHDQLVCHGIGAPDKETWNLEPWRPDVGLLAVMAARCNPVD